MYGKSNIDEIIARYKARSRRVEGSVRHYMRKMGSWMLRRAIQMSSHTQYKIGRMKVKSKSGKRYYPYSRDLPAHGPPLGDDSLINVQSGDVNKGWYDGLITSDRNSVRWGVYNKAPHTKFIFCEGGTRRMRARQLPEVLARHAHGHVPELVYGINRRILQDADIRP